MPPAAWNGRRSSRPKRENSWEVEALLFPPATGDRRRSAPDVRLDLGASRASPPQCDPGAASPARSCLSASPAALARSAKTCRWQHDQVPLLRFLTLLTAQSAE